MTVSVFRALPVRASEYVAVLWDKEDDTHMPLVYPRISLYLELGNRVMDTLGKENA